MVNILIGCTGSVATIKLPILVKTLLKDDRYKVRVITTEAAKHFFSKEDLPASVEVFDDANEWNTWSERGDPILHIDLGKWANIFILAPLDANTLAKIANGICDNLLTSTIRAWDFDVPLLFCPAMNTRMYEHPLTKQQIDLLMSWKFKLIPVIEKTLVCGDTGLGAMAEVDTIVKCVQNLLH